MLALLKVAGGVEPFGAWLKHSDSIAARRTEKLDSYLEVLYMLLEDVVRLANGGQAIRNEDLRAELEALARRVSFRLAARRGGQRGRIGGVGAPEYPEIDCARCFRCAIEALR